MYLRKLTGMTTEIYLKEEAVLTNITSTNKPLIKNEKMDTKTSPKGNQGRQK